MLLGLAWAQVGGLLSYRSRLKGTCFPQDRYGCDLACCSSVCLAGLPVYRFVLEKLASAPCRAGLFCASKINNI
jgi:hypothetical protein